MNMQYYGSPQPNVGNNSAGFVNLPQQTIFNANVQFKSLSFVPGTGTYSNRPSLNLIFTLLDQVDPNTGKNMFAYGGLSFVPEIQKPIIEFLLNSQSKHKTVTLSLLQMSPTFQLVQHLPVMALPGIISQLVGTNFLATIQRTQTKDGSKNILNVIGLQPLQQTQAAVQPTQSLPQQPVTPLPAMAPVNNSDFSAGNVMAPIPVPQQVPVLQNTVLQHPATFIQSVPSDIPF